MGPTAHRGPVLGDQDLLPDPEPVEPVSVEEADDSGGLLRVHGKRAVGIGYATVHILGPRGGRDPVDAGSVDIDL